MGTPEFAVPSLEAIIKAGYEVPAVVTQPDRRGNRGKVIPSPVKAKAMEYGIDILQPERIRGNEEFLNEMKTISPDMIVVAAFGQILPKSVLDLPRLGCINVHGSLLPKLRGAAPMQQAVAMGIDTTGVTIMRMDVGLDTGDMISRTEIDIRGLDITEVSSLLSCEGAKLLADTIPSIEDGSAEYVPQCDDDSSYAKPINKADGLTDFNEPAEVIECRIRAYKEWPVVHSFLGDRQVKIYAAENTDEQSDGEPGTVTDIEKNSFSINCCDRKLRITELQLQGKKRMGAGDFMRGYRLSCGDRFKREV